MRTVLTISALGLKDYYRRKIFIITLLIMFVVAGTGLLANPFTLGFQSRLIRDIALLFIQLFTIFFALALGATAIPNEIERKMIYPFLARPLTRGQYLWGKFLAIALLVILNDLIFGAELIVMLAFSAREVHWMILPACLLISLESLVVIAFALWFSTFATPPVTFALMVLLYVVGNLSHIYTLTLTAGNSIMAFLLMHLKGLIPYFDYFSIRSAVTHDHPVTLAYFAMVFLYGALYIFVIMLLAEVSFLRKNL